MDFFVHTLNIFRQQSNGCDEIAQINRSLTGLEKPLTQPLVAASYSMTGNTSQLTFSSFDSPMASKQKRSTVLKLFIYSDKLTVTTVKRSRWPRLLKGGRLKDSVRQERLQHHFEVLGQRRDRRHSMLYRWMNIVQDLRRHDDDYHREKKLYNERTSLGSVINNCSR